MRSARPGVRWTPARIEAAAGIAAGLVLASAAWLGTGALLRILPADLINRSRATPPPVVAPVVGPVVAAVLPTPVPSSCDSGPSTAAYRAIVAHRPDILAFYAKNGYDPRADCRRALDDWLRQGEPGRPPTTAAAYAMAQGWLPTPVPGAAPRTPEVDCKAPPSVVATYGFDPYQVLLRSRRDVIEFYAKNGWDPATQCVQIYDDWVSRQDPGQKTVAAGAYVRDHGLELTPTPGPSRPATPAP